MSDGVGFSLDDILEQGGSSKNDISNSLPEEPQSTTIEFSDEDNVQDKKSSLLESELGEELSESHDDGLDSSSEEKRQKTLHLKEKNRRPSLHERQLQKIATQQDARIKALETALLEKQKKEESLRKVSQELYKYGTLKDKETIDNQEYILNAELKDAMYSGDVEKQIELNQKLRMIAANRVKLNNELPSYLADPQEEENYFGDNYYQQPNYDPQETERQAAFQEWYESNDYLQVEHLRKKAADIMEELEGELALDGKRNLVGTPGFFKEVDKRVRSSFKRNKMQSSGKYGSQPPIPVSNGLGVNEVSSEYSDREPWRKVKLTPDEIDTAIRTLGFVEQQKGRPLTKQQKIEQMQKALYNIRNINPQEVSLEDLRW